MIGVIGKTAGQFVGAAFTGILVVLEITSLIETERARSEMRVMRSRMKKIEGKKDKSWTKPFKGGSVKKPVKKPVKKITA
jgi:hypothetical protein